MIAYILRFPVSHFITVQITIVNI